MPENYQYFANQLIRWQQQYGRHHLPWQNARDPYRIWLSEIMLQQTQVSTVLAYYQRFLERFPSVDLLAAASVDDVLQLWAGLGYYARGRNLHRCAQVIMSEHDGKFPETPEMLASLPGIGRSTAAAIAVFAFGCKAAILDGNAKRVFIRCFGVHEPLGTSASEKKLWQLAKTLLPDLQVGAYTQGLMDLGSQVCKRQHPLCGQCPMGNICIAAKNGLQHQLPVRTPRQKLPERQTCMIFFTDGQQVLLERRPAQGIWGGLLAAPEMEKDRCFLFAKQQGVAILQQQPLKPLKHTFTHFRLNIESIACRVSTPLLAQGEPERRFEWVSLKEAARLAIPTPVKRLLKQLAGTIWPNDG